MPTQPLLLDLVIVLGAAFAVLLLSRLVRLPPVLGFMITGMLIGPHGLAVVREAGQVEALADIGVTLLLFVIGLELSIARIREFKRAFFLGGPLQVVVTVGAVYAMLAATRIGREQAVLAACLVALSSTAMVLRLISDRGEFAAPQGRVMTGILLFQDFAMVPMIALVPALAGGGGGVAPGPRVLMGIAAAVAAFVLARYLMPPTLAAVARSGVRELFVIGAVFFCLGSAVVTAALGLSAALGAFLAGILISESEYSHHIAAEITPFRDLFSSLFFVSIGMLLDPGFVAAHPGLVLGATAAVILLKTVIAAGCALAIGYPLRVAIIVGLGLSQIGEFSFVLGRLGREAGLLSDVPYQTFLAAAVITLGATPFIVAAAPAIGVRIARLVPTRRRVAGPARGDGGREGPGAAGPGGEPRPAGHVVIVGHGVNGRNLARVLRAVGIPYVVLELDGQVVRRARLEGETDIQFADATRPESLLRAGVKEASAIVFAIADPDAARRGVRLVRSMNRSAAILVRTRLVEQVVELRRLGADEVIPEEFETSIALFARVLRRLHVPSNVIRNQEKVLRSEEYEFLRGGELAGEETLARVTTLLAAGTTDSFLVETSSPAAGRTLRETGLRQRTGASVIAVVRDGKPALGPGADYRIEAGDVLLLVGSHAALEQAFVVLGAPEPSAGDAGSD